jgi:hypothetical protein
LWACGDECILNTEIPCGADLGLGTDVEREGLRASNAAKGDGDLNSVFGIYLKVCSRDRKFGIGERNALEQVNHVLLFVKSSEVRGEVCNYHT